MRAPVRPVAVDVPGLELEPLPDAERASEADSVARDVGGYQLAPRRTLLVLYGEAMAWHVPVFACRRQVGVK